MGLNDVAANLSGRLVAVGDNGTIRVSDDGAASWDEVTSETSCDLQSVLWTGSRWVAVGGWLFEQCSILTSTDGLDWDRVCLGGMQQLNGVATGAGAVVAVGRSEQIARSTDVLRWSAAFTGTRALNGVAWNGSRFVAVGEVGMIRTSPDGVTWTPRPSGTTEQISAVAWNGSAMVAVGYDATLDLPLVLVSDDNGLGWAPVSMAGMPNTMLKTIAWTGSRFVAAGSGGHMLTSPDGATWSHHQVAGAALIRGLCWDGLRLVGVGWGGLVVTAATAAPAAPGDWTIRSHAAPIGQLHGLAEGDVGGVMRVEAVGDYGTILSSDDGGESGSVRTSGMTNALLGVGATGMSSVRFIAVGLGGTILTSPDAVTWTQRASGAAVTLRAVDWFVPVIDPPLAVVVGDDGTIRTSPNGAAWSTRTSGTTQHLLGVASGLVESKPPGTATMRLVAVGFNGTILNSSGGTTWTEVDSGTTEHLLAVTFRNPGFVAVGGHGTVLTSADGTSWTLRGADTTGSLAAVTSTGSQLVATGDGGRVFTSPNGVDWTRRYAPVHQYLLAVAALSSGRLMAAGGDGLVMVSDPYPDFADWLAAQGVPPGQDGPDDDPNGDGISNLLAYGFGIPAIGPTTADDIAALPMVVDPAPGQRVRLRLSPHQAELCDIAYVIEESTTMEPGAWNEVTRRRPGQNCPIGALNILQAAGSRFAIIELPEILGSRPGYIARLRVERLVPP